MNKAKKRAGMGVVLPGDLHQSDIGVTSHTKIVSQR